MTPAAPAVPWAATASGLAGVCCTAFGCDGPDCAMSPDCTGPTGGGGMRGTSEPGASATAFDPEGAAWPEVAAFGADGWAAGDGPTG